MNKDMIIAIVLGILVVISVVQAIQLNNLKDNIATGGVATVSANSPVQGSGAGLPSNLQNLPEMVGGC